MHFQTNRLTFEKFPLPPPLLLPTRCYSRSCTDNSSKWLILHQNLQFFWLQGAAHFLYTGRRITFASGKSFDLQTSRIEFSVLPTFSSNVKVNPVISWNGSISADFPFKFSHFNLRGFSLQVSFSERTIQMFVGKIGWLKIAKWDLSIHSAAPRNEHIKT